MVAKISNVAPNSKPIILVYEYWSFGAIRKFSDLFSTQQDIREFIAEMKASQPKDGHPNCFRVLQTIRFERKQK